MTTEKRKALGRGLSALIPGAGASGASASSAPSPSIIRRDFFECAIEEITPSPDNPRQIFDEAKLQVGRFKPPKP